MRTGLFLLVILLGVCRAGAQAPAGQAPAGQAGAAVNMDGEGFVVKTGDMVPDFTVSMFDGKTVDIRDLRGKVVMIDFSGPYCKPCIAGMKRFGKEIFGRFEGQDLEVLVIMGLYTERSEVARMRAAQGFDFPMGLDPDGKVSHKFFMGGIPRYFVIDRTGKIVFHSSSNSREKSDTLTKVAAAIDGALKKG